MGRHQTPRRGEPLPSDIAEQPFRVRDAIDLGVGRGRLRGADLARPFSGVRVPSSTGELLEACRAYASLGRPDAFSHTTAAELFGAPLPRHHRHSVDDRLHVTVPGRLRGRQLAGVVGHASTRFTAVDLDGLRVIAPAQTWLDLAPMLSVEQLVAVGDFLIGGRNPLCDPDDLRRVAQTPRARGVRSARLALPSIRRGAESPQETALRLALIAAGLPEPEINYTVLDADGRFLARVDLAYPRFLVALEYEGDHHRTDQATWRKDITRREAVEDAGWRMIRVTADDLHPTPAELIQRIRRATYR